VTDFAARADEVKRLNTQLFKLMASNCGKLEDYFINQMFERNNADWYLTPEEAVKHDLANHVRVPKLTRKVSIDYTFE
jgi:ATP-dependent protease ClpP protease subunit